MKHYLFLSIYFLILFGCSSPDNLERQSMIAAKIIRGAADKLKTTKTENIIKDGEISGTEVYLNITESKKYLNSKMDILGRNYDTIKSLYESGGSQAFDALCVMAIINEYSFFLSMKAVDVQCTYSIELIKNKDKNLPSDWVLNDFYYKILSTPWFKDKNWPTMNREEKFESLLQTLMVGCESP
jgi:hypothetical protein